MRSLSVSAALLVSTPAVAQEIERDFYEAFDVRQGMRLRLEHGDGDVLIEPWDRDELEVEVHYRAEAGVFGFPRPADFTVDFNESGNQISVVGREPGSGGINLGVFQVQVREYTYSIQAPAYLDLELIGDDGDVEIGTWTGTLEATLDDGDILLQDMAGESVTLRMEDGDLEARGLRGEFYLTIDDGDVELTDCTIERARLRLEDGDLEVEDCAGDFDIAVDDGTVRLRSVEARNVEVRSEDGNIYVDLVGGGSPNVNLTSDDGRVELTIERGVSAELFIVTEDASIDVDLEDTDGLDIRRRDVSGSIGGGEGRIRIRTADGHISLRERN